MKENEKKGFSRRNFAKTTAAAGFAILSSKGAAAQNKNVDTLKVGLLGCGSRGSGALRDHLTGNKNVQVTALADLFEPKVKATRKSVEKQFADQCAVTDEQCFVGLDAYKKILATDIDILIEGTLPYSRPKHIAAAVEAKKHIFSEKPFAVDPTGVRMCIDASKKHKDMGLSMVGGTQRRHQKEYVETVKKIQDGAIGDVNAMRVYWCGGLPFTRERKPGESDFSYRVRNWYAYCWVCGDNIVEQHIHNLDVANWVLDSHPEEVFASGGRAWKQYEDKELYGDLWDTYSCDYTYPGGVHVFSFSRHWPKGSHGGVFEEAYGSKGTSRCMDMGERGMNPYVQEHVDLVNSIMGTGPYLHEGVRVAESTLTAIMGRMSAHTGKSLKWDDALNSDLNLVPDVWSFDLEYPLGDVPRPEVKK
ncbi:MAG: Gfo/Idh/MocA family oxidoreductase [bacterium]|nr:Gfo/Idh/MocA family oxidoreductase [bacterium]